MILRLVKLLEGMKKEGDCLLEDLNSQNRALAELNKDIEETKSDLFQIKVTITLAYMGFEID